MTTDTSKLEITNSEFGIISLALWAHAMSARERLHQLQLEHVQGRYVEPQWIDDCRTTANEAEHLYSKITGRRRTTAERPRAHTG